MFNELLQKIKENMTSLDGGDDASQIKKHFANTSAHLHQQMQNKSLSPGYNGLDI